MSTASSTQQPRNDTTSGDSATITTTSHHASHSESNIKNDQFLEMWLYVITVALIICCILYILWNQHKANVNHNNRRRRNGNSNRNHIKHHSINNNSKSKNKNRFKNKTNNNSNNLNTTLELTEMGHSQTSNMINKHEKVTSESQIMNVIVRAQSKDSTEHYDSDELQTGHVHSDIIDEHDNGHDNDGNNDNDHDNHDDNNIGDNIDGNGNGHSDNNPNAKKSIVEK